MVNLWFAALNVPPTDLRTENRCGQAILRLRIGLSMGMGMGMGGRAGKKAQRTKRQTMRAKRKYQRGDVAGGDMMAAKAFKSAKGAKKAGRKAAGSGIRVGRKLRTAGTAAASGNYAGAGMAFV